MEQCENGLLYDGKGNVHNHCNYHWDVDCGTRKADSEFFFISIDSNLRNFQRKFIY